MKTVASIALLRTRWRYSHFVDLWLTWEQHRGRGCVKLDTFPVAQHAHLSRFRGQPVRMLEIGVWVGGSLEIWQEYLGPDATIIGADIEPGVRQNAPDFEVHIGDQSDPVFLAEVVAQSGPFDIVIDDGGHTFEQQRTSFDVLYPLLNDGGVYIVEDVCTSYWSEFGGGVGAKSSFVEYAKSKIDELNADFVDADAPNGFTRSTTSISFHQGMIAFEKHANEPTRYLLSQDGALSRKGMQFGLGWVD